MEYVAHQMMFRLDLLYHLMDPSIKSISTRHKLTLNLGTLPFTFPQEVMPCSCASQS